LTHAVCHATIVSPFNFIGIQEQTMMLFFAESGTATKTDGLTHVADLIRALVSFLWLALAGIAFWKFYVPLKEAIDSRSLSVDIGGFKLSFPEAAEGLKKQVSDLQTKMAQMENELTALSAAAQPPQGPVSLAQPATPFDRMRQYAITGPGETLTETPPKPGGNLGLNALWVDDNPKWNAYEIAAIQDAGGKVDTALSTAEALEKFEKGRYQVVITDMGRREGMIHNRDAGLDLIKAIRAVNGTVPILVFTGVDDVRKREKAVEELGAQGITSSSVELLEMLRRIPRS
jgi:hypothetical protein